MTRIRFEAQVLVHVHAEQRALDKSLVALVACKWLLSGVQTHMHLQLGHIEEGLVTSRARISSIVRVTSHMHVPQMGQRIRLRTECARVRSFAGVHSSVQRVLVVRRETPVAVLAFVWFLAGVNTKVVLQIAGIGKGGAAAFAYVHSVGSFLVLDT